MFGVNVKVGIYILDAMISGVTTFSFELARGFKAAGHHCDTIHSTKSGQETIRWSRPDGGARWWREPPDLTVAHAELAATLDNYDLVVVSDLGASTVNSDKPEPGYLDGLRRTKTPWMVVAHGNSYDDAHAPHFRALIENARAFTGVVLACTAPYDYDEHPMFKDLLCLPIKRPYTPMFPDHSTLPQLHSVGSIGRFSTGKNLHLLAFAWPWVGTPFVELHGAAINSIRPCDPYLTYETILKNVPNLTVFIEPTQKNKTSEWMVGRGGQPGDPVLRYAGAYADPKTVLQRLRVFVNLTSSSFSAGTEYTTMEAIDAGCMVLVPEGLIDNGSQFSVGLLPRIDVPRSVSAGMQQLDLLRLIAGRATAAAQVDEQTRQTIAEWNRQTLRLEHDPRVVATSILNRVGGGA